MNRKDFAEIINLKAEHKEYVRFLKGKHAVYKTYAEWDAHIKDLLFAIKSPTDMYNLKRYCADVVRANNDSAQLVWAYLGLSFPLALAFATEKDIIGLRGWINGCVMVTFLACILFTSSIKARKKHFFEDIHKIIEQIENHS